MESNVLVVKSSKKEEFEQEVSRLRTEGWEVRRYDLVQSASVFAVFDYIAFLERPIPEPQNEDA